MQAPIKVRVTDPLGSEKYNSFKLHPVLPPRLPWRQAVVTTALVLLAACGDSGPAPVSLPDLTVTGHLVVADIQPITHEFGRIGDVGITNSGQIVATDILSNRIEVFDSLGKWIGSVGGPGEGPGEYRSITSLASTPDSLYVMDFDLQRITSYRISPDALPTLAHARSVAYPGQLSRHSIAACDCGDLYLQYASTTMRNGVESERPLIVRRLRPDNAPVDADSVLVVGDREWLLSASGTGHVIEPMPFGNRSIMRLVDDTTLLVAWTGSPTVRLYAPDGSLRDTLTMPFPSNPVTQGDVDAYIESIRNSKRLFAQMESERVYKAWNEDRLPDHKPLFHDILIDDQARLWVTRISPRAQLLRLEAGVTFVEPGDSADILVIAIGDESAAVARIPNLRVVAVHGNQAVAVSKNSDNVETLQLMKFGQR